MQKGFELDFLEEYSKPTLISELKRIQNIIGNRPITKKDIDKYGKAGWTTYFRKFGSFSNALLEAKLKPSRRANISNEILIQAVVSLWTKTLEKEGRRPLASDLKTYSVPYSEDTFRRRFGSWKKALTLAYNSVDTGEGTADLQTFARLVSDKKTTKTQREEPSIRKRFLVFKRDQFACALCGRSGLGVILEVDHKIPISKGGSNQIGNLQTLCFECNRGKRNDLEV